MAFSEYHGTIASGASMRVSKVFTTSRVPPELGDPLAIYLMASPLKPSRLLSFGHSKATDFVTGRFIYSVNVLNQGEPTDFMLQGGGLI